MIYKGSEKTDEQKLSPEIIISKLFYFHSQAHFNHLQTKSYSQHKALDELYSSLVDFKDSIGELLLGYIYPNRYNQFINENIENNITNEDLVLKIKDFSYNLYLYSEENKWVALSNKSAELSELANKILYFLTLE
jgi:Family of unknown function (DUF5856)